MKRLFILFIGLALCGLAFTPAHADLRGDAVATVFAEVDPNIAVAPETPIVDAGSVQVGELSSTIQFRIDANLESVSMFVESSRN